MNRKYLATSLSVVLTLTNGVGALGGALAKDARPVSIEAAAFVPAGNTATPIGAGCKVCDRADCAQRAFPPLGRTLQIDENQRGFAPYASGM